MLIQAYLRKSYPAVCGSDKIVSECKVTMFTRNSLVIDSIFNALKIALHNKLRNEWKVYNR